MTEEIEKNSPTLNRNATYERVRFSLVTFSRAKILTEHISQKYRQLNSLHLLSICPVRILPPLKVMAIFVSLISDINCNPLAKVRRYQFDSILLQNR